MPGVSLRSCISTELQVMLTLWVQNHTFTRRRAAPTSPGSCLATQSLILTPFAGFPKCFCTACVNILILKSRVLEVILLYLHFDNSSNYTLIILPRKKDRTGVGHPKPQEGSGALMQPHSAVWAEHIGRYLGVERITPLGAFALFLFLLICFLFEVLLIYNII